MRHLLLLSFLILGLWPFSSFAAPDANTQEEKLVKIRLLPERATVKGGETLWVGIEQSIAPHWHTYWRNPGDSGTPPRIVWTLPEGFEIEEILWPVPEKLPYEPLLNYGYAGNAVFLQKLRVPEALPEGPLTFSAETEILVCKEECIPEYGQYTFTLNDSQPSGTDSGAYLKAALEKIPLSVSWPASFTEKNGRFVLKITHDPQKFLCDETAGDIAFFPVEWGLVDNTGVPQTNFSDGQMILHQKRGDRPLEEVETLNGVIVCQSGDGTRQGFAFVAEKSAVLAASFPHILRTTDGERTDNIWVALIFALLGGLVLNLMPCVFPVLSIKALSLVKIAEKHPETARMHGLSYSAGVVLSFVLIAAVLIILKAGGAQIGWGFHLQNPYITGGLAILLLLIGLNFSGVFALRTSFGNIGGTLARREGLSGSFFTGVLAALVATPCTAPFMAGAVAYALLQPAYIAFIVFAALGVGLALPYLLLSFIPALQRLLPKPGRWMETFRHILAVPMFLAAIWLFWVFSQQVMPRPHPAEIMSLGSAYSEAALAEALEGDDPVFVEMTAAWCITCKVNHAIAIDVPSTRALFSEMKVVYLVGDWTNEDPAITKFLSDSGRNGVPLYIFYGVRNPATGERPAAVILPQILTPHIVERFIQGEIL
ncbi:MAG: thioredoxin family protein [Alphaproteobacteria bacterium]|nr:thioredoxin family protein [Alphaproteobacteria bacterium]